jgi:hypothetical protein
MEGKKNCATTLPFPHNKMIQHIAARLNASSFQIRAARAPSKSHGRGPSILETKIDYSTPPAFLPAAAERWRSRKM